MCASWTTDSVVACAYCCQVGVRQAAQRWADVWERGWREHDAAAIVTPYAEGAFWQQHPFRDPEPDYLAAGIREGGVGPVPVRHPHR